MSANNDASADVNLDIAIGSWPSKVLALGFLAELVLRVGGAVFFTLSYKSSILPSPSNLRPHLAFDFISTFGIARKARITRCHGWPALLSRRYFVGIATAGFYF